MHRLLRRAAIAAGLAGLLLELRAWRRAFLGVGEIPTVTSRIVARHPGLDDGGSSSALGWPPGVQEDDRIRWSWKKRPRQGA
jgi:hypothetical protein